MTDQAEAYPALSEQSDAEYELESEEGSLWTGTRLLVGILTMLWAGVTFSYFYLKAVDVGKAWYIPGVEEPSILMGSLIGGIVLIGALMLSYGAFRFRQGLAFEWNVAAWLTAALGLISGGFQAWELARIGFNPGESGFSSMFIGFATLNSAFIIGGAIWAEILAARTIRLSMEIGPEDYLGVSTKHEVRLLRASISGAVFFWWFMVAIELLFYVLFYIRP